jgi:hypothetical protein
VTRLRQYLAVQNSSPTTDPVTLPPALVSILLPHINNALSSKGTEATSSSSTVNTALTQWAHILQEENDELYELLKSGETGKLKEEVRGLRRVVERLEGALRGMCVLISSIPCVLMWYVLSESHQVIASLS